MKRIPASLFMLSVLPNAVPAARGAGPPTAKYRDLEGTQHDVPVKSRPGGSK